MNNSVFDADSDADSDPWALRKEAKEHRKAGRYTDALRLYAILWGQENTRTVWDGWGYAFCLDKISKTREALEVCREAYRLDSNHHSLRQLYARCIYQLELKTTEGNLARMQKAAIGICKLVSQDEKYAPYVVPAVLTVAAEFKQRRRYDDVLKWLDRFDPALLSTKPFEYEQEGRKRQGPSDAQRYWGLRCKALYETGAYAACREAVAQALRMVSGPVNDGDVWLHRLSALSRAAEGEAAAAYNELASLLGKKPTWFLEYDLARLARDLGRRDDAWRHLLKVLLDSTPPKLRVRAFELASEWLEEEGDREAAKQHFAVSLALRNAEGWPIKETLKQHAQTLGANLPSSFRKLIRELTPLWQKRLDALEPLFKGVITKVIADGRAGFVRSKSGESFYFRSSDLRGARPKLGLSVTFRTAPGFDRKKKQATTNAVDLHVVGDV
jgi:tetratricopeptide (TPR) repeat protein